MTPFESLWVQADIELQHLSAIEQETDLGYMKAHSIAFGQVNRDLITFQIPKFQRGLRWSPAFRLKFAKSLREGRPCGTLVFARVEDQKIDELTVKTWFVLDGQQRISACSIILKNFWTGETEQHGDSYYDLGPVNRELEALAEILNLETKSLVRFFKEMASPDEGKFGEKDLQESRELLTKWCQVADVPFPAAEDEPSAVDLVGEIRRNLLAQYNALKLIEIPIQLYQPAEGSPPSEVRSTITEIFESLNTNVPLKATELLAAKWEQFLIQWPPVLEVKRARFIAAMLDDMKNRIERTYEEVSEKYEYIPEVEAVSEDNVSLFDLLHSLSLRTSYEYDLTTARPVFLSGTRDKRRVSETVAFDSVRLFLGGDLHSGDVQIERRLESSPGEIFSVDRHGRLDVPRLIEVYMDTAKIINTALKSVSSLNEDSPNTKTLGDIAAPTYIANYLAIQKRANFETRRESLPVGGENMNAAQRTRNFKACLKAWWLRDVLADEFQGSDANRNANSRVWTSFEGDKPNTTMCHAPTVGEFLRLFADMFVQEAVIDKTPERKRLSEKGRAMMHIVFVESAPRHEKVQREHIVPWVIRDDGARPLLPDPLPLNHSANFMPLDPKINNSRKNISWNDYIERVPNAKRAAVKKCLILDPAEFTDDVRASLPNFITVLVRRWVRMCDVALMNLDHKDWLGMSPLDRCKALNEKLVIPIEEGLKNRSVDFEPGGGWKMTAEDLVATN